ncbi:TcfC E-set like domain-containing protein [Vibrio brasiliensis]|uniref:TcfC E-set like domain-containing protein n=1 Tax=Vibrio brasiliensis TaxID=170652 RepID=UPI001EFE20C4|nr:TcfC E-set like domain-containing protein [Vibrio brasiliensis]MCG9781536.1 TcfC E-set like domain-containing protein [Vibrio brasiliensis]
MIDLNRLVVFISIMTSFQLLANSYPSEFSDFFEDVEKEIEIQLVGVDDTLLINSIVNFERLKLSGDKITGSTLHGYLIENNIKNHDADKIVKDLTEGIKKHTCMDELDSTSCIENTVKDNGNYYDYDFDEQKLIIYVGAEKFNETFIRAYHDGDSNRYSLINSTSLYLDSTGDRKSMYFRDELTLGMPYGYLFLDTSIRKGFYDDTTTLVNLDAAVYTLDIEDSKLMLGQTANNLSFNETDFFNYGINSDMQFIALGSSTDLARGGKGKIKRLYFYAEQDARVEVYKDQRVILTKVVKRGPNYISYDELPRGIYTIEIVEKTSDEPVVLEKKLITNTAKFALAQGQFDYQTGIAQAFKDSSEVDDYSLYGYGKFTYRLSESSIVGASLSASSNNVYFQPGLKLAVTDNSAIDYMLGLFDSGAMYSRLSYNFYNFYAQAEKYKSVENNYDLSSYLYGDDSYANVTLGLSGEFFTSRYYIQYDLNDSDLAGFARNGVISSGLNKSTSFGMFDLYGQFQRSDDIDDWKIAVTWTYDLGEGFSTSLAHRYDSYRNTLNEASLSYYRSEDSWTANVRLNNGVGDDNKVKNTLTAFATGENQYVKSDVYGSYDNESSYSLSVSLSNTQMLDKEGLSITSKKSNAFVRLSVEGAEEGEEVAFSMKNDYRYSGREIVSTEEKVLPIQSYSNLDVYVDEGIDYQRSVKRYSQFMYPGSILNVSPSYSKVKSIVLILEDFFGDPVESAQCIGQGCVSIEPVTSDGVFRLNTVDQSSYRVVSKKRLCLLDDSGDNMYSRGLCLPDKNSVLASLVEHDFESDNIDKEDIFFVGVFDSDRQYKHIIDSLAKARINYEVKDIGYSLFVFITNNTGLSLAQIEAIKNVQSFVINMEGQESLYSIKSYVEGDDDV